MECPECAEVVEPGEPDCPYCGCPLGRAPGRRGRAAPKKSNATIIVVAVCGGGALLLFLIVVLALMGSVDSRANRSNCKNNLKQLGLGLILYRDNQGKGVRYPDRDGAEFLTHLWHTGVMVEPDLYLCPSSGDSNDDGAMIQPGNGSEACSYAGRRNRNQSRYPGAYSMSGSSETLLAADDTDGDAHHGEAIVLLFMDGHVEERMFEDPQTGSMGGGGLLDPLAN